MDGPALQTRLRIGAPVTLLLQTVDRYGRTVAEVIGEVNLNLAMVEDGQAFAYRQYLGQCNAKEYLDAEYRASRHRFSVWQLPGGITRPWEFRRARRSGGGSRVVSSGVAPAESAPAAMAGQRYRCRQIGSFAKAQELLRQATPTSMAMVMGWPARVCAERTDTRTFGLWSSSACSLPSSFERHAHGSHRI